MQYAIQRLLLPLLLCVSAASFSDTLQIPVGSQTSQNHRPLPQNGQLKQDVRNLLGDPQAQKGPVGNPPITAWSYGDIVVYFEYDTVLHSVIVPR